MTLLPCTQNAEESHLGGVCEADLALTGRARLPGRPILPASLLPDRIGLSASDGLPPLPSLLYLTIFPSRSLHARQEDKLVHLSSKHEDLEKTC